MAVPDLRRLGVAVYVLGSALSSFAQALPAAILEVDPENYVQDRADFNDASKLDSVPSQTTTAYRPATPETWSLAVSHGLRLYKSGKYIEAEQAFGKL